MVKRLSHRLVKAEVAVRFRVGSFNFKGGYPMERSIAEEILTLSIEDSRLQSRKFHLTRDVGAGSWDDACTMAMQKMMAERAKLSPGTMIEIPRK